MKSKTLILIIISVVLLGGCNIFTLYPIYTEKDLVSIPDFEGNWTDKDGEIIKIEKTLKGNQKPEVKTGIFPQTYTYSFSEKGKTSSVYAHLIQLGNTTFMDFYPTENFDKDIDNDLLAGNLLPVHTFYKVEISSNQLVIFPYKLEWLDDLFKEKRIKISHETVPYYGDSLRILTASTEELQKFIAKYAHDQQAFEDPDILKRKL